MDSIHRRLKQLRQQREWSTREAARRIGVPETTYREWEYGRSVRGDLYPRIARAFDVKVEELFGVNSIEGDSIEDWFDGQARNVISLSARIADGKRGQMINDTMRMLVVEDSEDLVLLWKALFRRAGIRAVFSNSGKSALSAVIEGFVPDILMTDFYLPDMTGADLIEKVREINPNLKSLVVTGNSNSDFKSSIPTGSDVLIKPVKFDSLKTRLEKMGLRGGPPKALV